MALLVELSGMFSPMANGKTRPRKWPQTSHYALLAVVVQQACNT